MSVHVLVVEDDFALRSALTASIEVSGYKVSACENAETAVMQLAKSTKINIVITDIQMGSMSGIDLLKHIRKSKGSLPVILMTAFGDVTNAVEAMKLGACDYLQKPFEPEKLTCLIDKYLPKITEKKDIVITDPASVNLYQYASKIALTSSNVLLSGESGSGKEVMAKFIHNHSTRKEQNFVAINCAAIPENMLESTLFGFEKGAFTGAHQTSMGKFEQAQDGTLLLDEISEMPLSLQAKILRVIQEKEVERLGGKKSIKLNVRIIATTNRNLVDEVKQKKFREDLYYRLNVFPICCLGLRQRPKDIIPLAESLLEKYQFVESGEKLSFSPDAKLKLIAYKWPGNVRELDNLIQRVAVLSTNTEISESEIVFEGHSTNNEPLSNTNLNLENNINNYKNNDSKELESQLGNDMRHHEYQLIIESLANCQGKKKAVAEQLGISARTLRYKIAKMREAGYCIPDKKSLA